MLVIAALCHLPHPEQSGMIDFSNRSICTTLDGLWKKMANQGLITQVIMTTSGPIGDDIFG